LYDVALAVSSTYHLTVSFCEQVEDKYTAYVYNIFVRPKKIEFKVSDVKVPAIPGMFTTFKAKDVPLFVEGSQFQDRTHYGKIMGYDKPLDLM
jgi:transmembrane protein 70